MYTVEKFIKFNTFYMIHLNFCINLTQDEYVTR